MGWGNGPGWGLLVDTEGRAGSGVTARRSNHQKEMNKVHDGDRVRVRLAHLDIRHQKLAEHIGVAPSTLSRMLNLPSWRTDHLQLAGEFMDINFFEAYLPAREGDRPVMGVIISRDYLEELENLKKESKSIDTPGK